jgi:plasmid stabilization system protein ParE
MGCEVRLTAKARGDLNEIVAYIAQDNPLAAEKLGDELVASLGREVSIGRIVHGDDHTTLKVKTSAMTSEVRKRLERIATLLSNPAPPDLV